VFDKLKQASQLAGMLKDLPKLQATMEEVRANRMVAEAVNDALTRARARMAEEIGRAAKDSGIDLPPHILEKLA